MEQTKKFLRIDGNIVEAVETDLNLIDLQYYPENPRIHSIIESEFGENPTQEQIESKMKSLEHVKELKNSIRVNGGLLEPIFVQNNIVLEGNSRLAAYRILSEEDPVRWGRIRAVLLPSDVTPDQIFSMLGTMHIIGKTPWSPFEQAAYIHRRLTTSRKNIDAIADDLGLGRAYAHKLKQTYEQMVQNDDLVRDKWSYYFEYVKNGAIQKAIENYPQYSIKDNILERIKEDKFSDAREIRKVGKIVGAECEVAPEAIQGFLDDTMSLDDAVELVESESKVANLIAKIRNFNITISNENNAIRQNVNDIALKMELQKLVGQLKTILGID